MCGSNSAEAVVVSKKGIAGGAVISKDAIKVLFVVEADGTLGISHSEVRQAFKLTPTRKYVNMRLVEGKVEYENGVPEWFGKFQKSAEAQLKAIVKASQNYNKAILTLQTAHDKAVKDAIVRADKALETRKAAELAKVIKLGGKLL